MYPFIRSDRLYIWRSVRVFFPVWAGMGEMESTRNEEKPNFSELYARCLQPIRNFVLKMTSFREADDLVQEIFFRVSKGLPDFRGESSITTWLYRIATNVCLDWIKKKSARPVEPVEEIDRINLVSSLALPGQIKKPIEEKLVEKEMNECLHYYIRGLPVDYRTVLILSDIESLKNREIADILGVSLATVKIRLHRARDRLKRTLESNCNFYHDRNNNFACFSKKPFGAAGSYSSDL